MGSLTKIIRCTTSYIVHLAGRAEVLAYSFNKANSGLIGKCPEAPNDTIYEKRCAKLQKDHRAKNNY